MRVGVPVLLALFVMLGNNGAVHGACGVQSMGYAIQETGVPKPGGHRADDEPVSL